MTVYADAVTAADRAFTLVEAVDAPHLYHAVAPDYPPHYPHQL